MPEIDHVLADVFADPCASDWLKDALRAALRRDPVDAANDAECLALLLDERARATLDTARIAARITR